MFIDDIRTDKSCIRISIIWIYHTIKLVEDRVKKEDIKMKLFVKQYFINTLLIRKCMNRNNPFIFRGLLNTIFMKIMCTIISEFLV